MIELYNIDCMKYLKTLEDNAFDLAIVDPPYGIERLKKKGRFVGEGLSWDIKPNKKYFEELFRVSKNQIIWGYNHLSDKLPICTCFIFWDKDISVENYSDGELAWTSFQGVAKKIKIVWDGFRQDNMKNKELRIHPTQKPVKLYEWLLMNYAKEGEKILDTHLGSGSIAIACHNLGFDLVGCELDTDYYNAACKRLKQHQAQLTIF
jgi:site-specific DNA-methyltransferase (adenine-specific)